MLAFAVTVSNIENRFAVFIAASVGSALSFPSSKVFFYLMIICWIFTERYCFLIASNMSPRLSASTRSAVENESNHQSKQHQNQGHCAAVVVCCAYVSLTPRDTADLRTGPFFVVIITLRCLTSSIGNGDIDGTELGFSHIPKSARNSSCTIKDFGEINAHESQHHVVDHLWLVEPDHVGRVVYLAARQKSEALKDVLDD